MVEHRKLEGKGVCKCGKPMYFFRGRWWCPIANNKKRMLNRYVHKHPYTRKYKKQQVKK